MPGRKPFVGQEPDLNSPQLRHGMSDGFKHLSDLLIAAFVKHHLEPGIRIALFQPFDLGARRANSVLQPYASPQPRYRSFRRHALHLDGVDLGNTVAGRRYEISEVAIVGQEQQAFGIEIKPPDRMKSAEIARN
jgi:hypothetical protein